MEVVGDVLSHPIFVRLRFTRNLDACISILDESARGGLLYQRLSDTVFREFQLAQCLLEKIISALLSTFTMLKTENVGIVTPERRKQEVAQFTVWRHIQSLITNTPPRRLRNSRVIKSTFVSMMLIACYAVGAFGQSGTPVLPSTVSSAPPGDASRTYSISASPSSQRSADTPQLISADHSRYIISSGDVVDITVYGAPDLSQRLPVNHSGDVYLPLVNYMHLAGLNTEEAQLAIEKALLKGGFVNTPHVTVAVSEYTGGVVLMGEITKPGIYPVIGTGRLFDLLTAAGGITPNAGQIITITHPGGVQETVSLSSNPKLQMDADVPVGQGDTVIVSKAGVVYVVGEVLNPSGFVMDEKGQYTVMKLVAMAHGTTKLAKTSKARIVRRTPDGQKEIPVPLDKILASKAPDIPLEANDILFVPTNGAKRAAERSTDVAIALATGVTIIAAQRF